MKKTLLIFVQSLFFVVFACLLLNHLVDFQVKYIRYASLPFIINYNLWLGYYFMMFVEVISLITIVGVRNRFFVQSYDVLLFLYLLFVSVSIINIYKIAQRCIECHYFAHIVPDHPFITLALIWLVALLWFFILHPGTFKERATFANHN